MKAIKMIGLAALAALTVTIFVGASSAMAESTTLCSSDGSSCGVTHIHETSVGKAKFLTSFGTIECDALALGDVKRGTNALATPLVLEVNLTFSNCTLNGGSCSLTERNGPTEATVLKEGHETVKVTYVAFLVEILCGSSISCSYNGTNLVGTGKGPLLATQSNGEVSFFEQAFAKEAGCFISPKVVKLDVTLTPLTATYIKE